MIDPKNAKYIAELIEKGNRYGKSHRITGSTTEEQWKKFEEVFYASKDRCNSRVTRPVLRNK